MKDILLLLTDSYGGRGGIALYNRNLIQALSEIKAIKKITALPRKIFYKLERIPNKVIYKKKAANSKMKFFIEFLYLFFFKKYSLIICCHIHLLFFCWLLKKKNNCKLVLLIFGEEAWSPTVHKISNFFANKIDTLIAIRHYTAKKFIKWSGLSKKKYFYLKNCIDTEKYKSSKVDKKLIKKHNLQNKKIIISCGRLDIEDQYKGVDEIIDILPQLINKINNLVYLVIGDGNDQKRLINKAKLLKVDKNIIFLNNLSEKDKISFYKLGHIMAMAGSRKTFDTYPFRFVLLEGLASGMHVISSKSKYKTDLSEKSIIMLNQIDPKNKKVLINKIIELFQKKKNINPLINLHSLFEFKKKLKEILRTI